MKVKLTESKLKQIVAESVKKVLKESTCWYGDTKPFETIYQMADKIVDSLDAKFTPEYYEGWPDDFSYEDMYEWAKKVRDDAGEYINCNSRFISTNFVAESVKRVLNENTPMFTGYFTFENIQELVYDILEKEYPNRRNHWHLWQYMQALEQLGFDQIGETKYGDGYIFDDSHITIEVYEESEGVFMREMMNEAKKISQKEGIMTKAIGM